MEHILTSSEEMHLGKTHSSVREGLVMYPFGDCGGRVLPLPGQRARTIHLGAV